MTGETFTITKSYKVFQGEPKGEPMDEPDENQLFGWLLIPPLHAVDATPRPPC